MIDCLSLTTIDVSTNNPVNYKRMKTGTVAIIRLDEYMAEILPDLPGEGVLFPYLSRVRAGDRATEFASRCRQLGIVGVTLHSYRYAWAERATRPSAIPNGSRRRL
ncbi:MAG: hypothetical protein ACREE6_05715, partial [Limisphaerales bacterium]